VPYVEARYLQECVAEIARLKEELGDAADYSKTTYLTASEREKLQAVLNASLRQMMDAMPNAGVTGSGEGQ
jgi:type II secretory pathway component PulM